MNKGLNNIATAEIGLLPSGHLHWYAAASDGSGAQAPHESRLDKAFSNDIAEGLFTLAALNDNEDLSDTLLYWRNVASQYMNVRCLLPATGQNRPELIKAPDREQCETLLLAAPPMRGAEYLNYTVLQNVWSVLDEWVCQQSESLGGLAALLEKKATRWHQVGRVCFHLAENKNDSACPFAFMATYAPELSAQDSADSTRVRHQPLSRALQEYAGTKNKNILIRLLAPIHRASQASDLILKLVESGDIYHPLAWTAAEAYLFLKDIPLYEHSGVVVRLPDWWKQRPRPKVGIRIGERRRNNFGADALLDFKLDIALGEESITEVELQKLMAAGDGLAFIKGQWIEVDRQRLEQALQHWREIRSQTSDGLSFIEGMRLLAGAPADLKSDKLVDDERQWLHAIPGKWLETQLQTLRSPNAHQAADPGSALKATLRPYQKVGVNWLWTLSRLGLGACLADDMGLGKTMQIIALLLALKKNKKLTTALLVLPASLLANWKAELLRFGPSLNCLFVHPSQIDKKAMLALSDDYQVALENNDLVLTTYGMLMRQSWLQQPDWQLVILDEAQAIKNPATAQSKAVKKLTATARIALTGTPVENRLSDLWSLFDFINPGLLGSVSRFKLFVKALHEQQADQYAPLRNLVSPYILRRLKTDRSIISDLPDKSELTAYCGLSKSQAALYQQAVREMAQGLKNNDGIKRRGLVLSYLMRFKQICNHPAQLLGESEYEPQKSGKFQRLAELCEEIASRQEKLLVFTQFREMTAPLELFLTEQFGQAGLVLHGGTTVKQRQKRVDLFQDEAGPPFFVLSLKAGGTGLNLTQASHVIHFDRWWNAAVENQATDRAFRIGQKKNVIVHKFVCQGTVEEKIDVLIREKQNLADDLIEGNSGNHLTELDNAELLNLVSLDIEKTQIS